ncbi:MAG TPA: DUF835 domain-containing protein [Thermoplasmata archaeon]|nr:DUF835 domain-containing protein [Thermoplasmata archaeon]
MDPPDDGRAFARVEEEVRRLWGARGLPPRDGVLGRGAGALLRQLIGTFTPGDPPTLVAHRAVAADVDARASMLGGDRALGTLRREGWAREAVDPVVSPLLDALGVWTGGAERRSYDAEDRVAGVQQITGRLAALGLLVTRDGTVRFCPSCAAPRSPERAIYHEELGDTFLVRFPLVREGDGPVVDALAWVDAPWRVLGATALLVSPELRYATVEYRRGDQRARLLTLRSSLERLRSWLPGVELTVVDEAPGVAFAGRRYEFPLRHEFPDGASLPAPSGTVLAVPEVGDSGTGVVPLVPGHGGSDAQIAERLGVVGWPLLTARGTLDLTLMHKYSGLDLETANEFVARDLTESGSVLARLRVLRGVPYCGVCGRPLVWFPGRFWSLEPSRLPPELLARYAQLLPEDRPLGQLDPTPWPVSETTTSDAPDAVALRECDRCSRLEPPDASDRCSCGGQRRRVTRRLVPSVGGAFASWARNDPVGAGDTIRLYVGERRRVPTVVHQLAAMAVVDHASPEVRATILPTVSDVDIVGLAREHGADAVRSALVRTDHSEGPAGSFVERCRQEQRRLGRLVELATSLAGQLEPGDPAGPDREMQPEDRALLARWGQTELAALAAYEEGRPAEAHRRIARFLDVDLTRYREIVRPRLAPGAAAPSRRAAGRTLALLVEGIATALAPIAPFTAEAVTRALRPEMRSLFETTPFDTERPPPDEALADAWERWLAVVRALDRFRAVRRLAPETPIASVAIVVSDEVLGDRLRGDRALLERLAGITRLEVGSPRSPWEGRRRQLVPVESEIQRAYPARATQIVHLLRRMAPRRPDEAENGRGITVFVQGQPHQITPAMLAYAETLPERVVPTPFAFGEMYAEVPAGGGTGGGPPGALTLSADASWLVRRIARRLRVVGPEGSRALTVRVVAVDPLARELRDHWAAIAAELGVASLTIDAPTPGVPVAAAVTGRTRLGARWTAEIPGLDRPGGRLLRRPPRPASGSVRRMPIRHRPPGPAAEVDFSEDGVIRHEEAVRGLGQELDQLLGAPLLGPAKVEIAWKAGYGSVAELTRASFDELATLPGFGRAVAGQLFEKMGRPVPPPPRRARTATVRPRVRPPRIAPVVPPTAPASPPPPEPTLPPEPAPPVAVPALAVPTPPVVPADVERAPAIQADELPEAVVEAGPTVGEPVTIPPVPPPPVAPPPARPAAPPRPPLEPAFVPDAQRPGPAPEPLPPPIASAGIEVELSDALVPTLQPFLDATAAGHRGLAVVREVPERIRALVGPRPVAVYWLSNLVRDRTVRPGDLRALAALLRQGIEANGITAIFLEGIEYLTRIHGSSALAAFLHELDQLARAHDARVWVHLTPGLLSSSDLDIVLGRGPPPELPGDPGSPPAETPEAAPAPPAAGTIPAAEGAEAPTPAPVALEEAVTSPAAAPPEAEPPDERIPGAEPPAGTEPPAEVDGAEPRPPEEWDASGTEADAGGEVPSAEPAPTETPTVEPEVPPAPEQEGPAAEPAPTEAPTEGAEVQPASGQEVPSAEPPPTETPTVEPEVPPAPGQEEESTGSADVEVLPGAEIDLAEPPGPVVPEAEATDAVPVIEGPAPPPESAPPTMPPSAKPAPESPVDPDPEPEAGEEKGADASEPSDEGNDGDEDSDGSAPPA